MTCSSQFTRDTLRFWVQLYLAKTRGQKIVVPYCETPLSAFRNFSSLCTLNVTAAINCASECAAKVQRERRNSRAISPRRFDRRHTYHTVGSSSWIVLYLLWINSWGGTARVFVTRKHQEIKISSVLLFRLIYMYICIYIIGFLP